VPLRVLLCLSRKIFISSRGDAAGRMIGGGERGRWGGRRRELALNGLRGILRLTMDPKQIVHSDPEILGGIPVFVGTRVPVDALIDFLEGGDTIEDFLENYPGVSREQVFAFLEEASRALLAEIA
jgi:uncharacterized protein (DUF433 family)